MTSFYLSVVLILLFSYFRSIQGRFGRRGTTALVDKAALVNKAPRWSSTGSQGLDHENHELKDKEVRPVASKKKPCKNSPEDTLLEHHPYGSGVFSLDPKGLQES